MAGNITSTALSSQKAILRVRNCFLLLPHPTGGKGGTRKYSISFGVMPYRKELSDYREALLFPLPGPRKRPGGESLPERPQILHHSMRRNHYGEGRGGSFACVFCCRYILTAIWGIGNLI